MKTSIATVSLSGSLSEKLEAIAAAKFDAVEIFENDLSPSMERQPMSGRQPSSSVSTSLRYSRSAILRGCPIACATACSRAPSGSSMSWRSWGATS